MATKICSKCGEERPSRGFHFHLKSCKGTLGESKGDKCSTCQDRGYIELDKVGLLCQPCPDCEKGKEMREVVGLPTVTIELDGEKVAEVVEEGRDNG